MFVVVPLLFLVPGLVVCAPLGLRGWRLVAVAPAVTFGLAAVGGPVLSALHIRWTLLSFAVWTVVVAVVVFAAAQLMSRLRQPEGEIPRSAEPEDDDARPLPRAPWEHLTVGAGVLLGMAVGAIVYLRGTAGLALTSQDWDAPFHANAVRWIAVHGQAVPSAMAPIANFAPGTPYFYPITYHSVLALAVQQFGVDPSWVLNAGALTMVLLWPLCVAALGLAWRVPTPIVAVAAVVSTWFTAFPYDSLWRGPLWPYVAGLALVPGVLAASRMLIERSRAVPAAVTIALAVTGVVAMHPSIAFIVLVYGGMLVAALVLRLEPVRWRSAAVPMVVTGVLTVLILAPVVLPARVQGSGVEAARWPQFASSPEGFGQVLLFSPVTQQPQWWLGLVGLVGLVIMILRRRLLWLVGAFFVFGAAYAATASMDNWLVNEISGPFYNDAWRFAALLSLAGAFAVGESIVAGGTWLASRVRLGRSWVGPAGVAAVALVVLAVLGNGAYIGRNVERLRWDYHDGPTVSAAEKVAYVWLGHHLRSGERVMNDRLDGSVWMYATAGVEPMEWTFYGAQPGSVADDLHGDLNQMDHDASVRRELRQAHVRYVIVGEGFVRDVPRAPGLRNLDKVQGLRQVFHNSGATIYEVESAALG